MILISSQFSGAFAETTVISFDARVVSDNNGYHDVIFSGKSNAVNLGHQILILDPDGLYVMNHGTDSDSDGNFGFAYDIFIFNKYGTYTATAFAQFELESEGLVATFEIIETEEPNQVEPPLTVFTDRSSYRTGDVISIYGDAGKIMGFPIILEVFDPIGNKIFVVPVFTYDDHKFSTEVSTTNDYWNTSGTYTIIGTYIPADVGTYSVKILVQFEAVPITVPDTDYDGIDDSDDQCVNDVETMNGFEDTDGCPDVIPIDDLDNDGIDDSLDNCPTQSETVNGFEDTDGCPDVIPIGDLDNDGIDDLDNDGIDDSLDNCPTQSETVNGFEDTDGCPDTVLSPQPEPIDRKITICHIPQGNPSNAHTIIVPLSAWHAHYVHGDNRGECPLGSANEIAEVYVEPTSKWDAVFGLAGSSNAMEQNIPETIDSPLKQNIAETIDSPLKQNLPSISISSDESTYADGSIIHIDGNVKDIQPNSMIIVRVYSPSNYNIVDERLFVSDGGKFEIDFDTSDKLWFENGEYVVKVEDQNHNGLNQIKVTVVEPNVEFTAFAQEPTTIESASYDDDKLVDLIDENKKLRGELERQGSEIKELDKQVDYLSDIIASIQRFFGGWVS